MINLRTANDYCKEYWKIENYLNAIKDPELWECHHKLEIHEDYINTSDELKMMNLYYNRPPEELIFLPLSEHKRLHVRCGWHHSDETKAKLSTLKTGIKYSEETKLKKSISMKGKNTGPRSDEVKCKISEATKGRIPWNKGLKLKK